MKSRRGGGDGEGGKEEEKGSGRKRGQNGRKCVSEQVISRKQITLKRQPEGRNTEVHREEIQVGEEKGGGGGETHQQDAQKNPKLSQIVKIKRVFGRSRGSSPEAWWRRSGTPSQRGSSTRYWSTAGHKRRRERRQNPHCPNKDGRHGPRPPLAPGANELTLAP